jgi:hypothetical protein
VAIRDRIERLEAAAGPRREQAAEADRLCDGIRQRFEVISAELSPEQCVECAALCSSIVAGRDPLLLQAFQCAEYGDWLL